MSSHKQALVTFDNDGTLWGEQPMLEMLAYLRANGFKTFIVSGGGIEFMRPWAAASRPSSGCRMASPSASNTTSAGASLCLFVHHPDAERDDAYDRTSPIRQARPRRGRETRLDRGRHEK